MIGAGQVRSGEIGSEEVSVAQVGAHEGSA